MLKWTFLGVLLMSLVCYTYYRIHRLDGHWHVISEDGFIYSLDFSGVNGIANKSLGSGIGGIYIDHNPWKNELSYGMECLGYSAFTYYRSNGKLTFGKYRAYKAPLCNYQRDFFRGIPLEIDLPYAADTSYLYRERVNRSLEIPIYIGKRKLPYTAGCDFTIRDGDPFSPMDLRRFRKLQLFDFGIYFLSNFLDDPYDLSIYLEKQRIKVPETKRDQMFIRIYADKEIPASMIEILTSELRKHDFSEIYRVYQPEKQLYDYFQTFDRMMR
ncbi:MAG: hypothetical protein R2824_23555 [Saprospiraceae bacterium]|nr:hypothetical protein [Lewinella sp.]